MSLPEPTVSELGIAGLFQVGLVVGDDPRGSFREAWQNAKMQTAGLPAFQPVQYNVAESKRGVIRGIHAEPWEKYIHVTSGEVFAAWVDLRTDSPTFKQVVTLTLDGTNAAFVPRGVGNAYAVTSPTAVYTYLVNEHWRPDADYPAVAYDDPALSIDWPIPEGERIVSDKDRTNPTLNEAFPE